jgi:hypothetical protein
MILGLVASIDNSDAPVRSSTKSTFFHVAPPSMDLNTARARMCRPRSRPRRAPPWRSGYGALDRLFDPTPEQI